MKRKSRAYSFVFTWKSWLLLSLTFLMRFNAGYAQGYTESFNDITTLPGSGWFLQNNSSPLGPNRWFQGTPTSAFPDAGPFDAYAGVDNAYIAASFASTTGGTGTISNWLVTPNRTLRNGDVFTFYTRKSLIGPTMTDFPDRLEVRLSTNGASTNVGTTAFGFGDFTTTLLSINPTLVTNVYPQTWTLYTITISGLPAPTSGRIAFRYFVTNGGPSGANSDYIGVDEVTYTPYVCPVLTVNPSTLTGGVAGSAYNRSLSQTGALGAPGYTITAGALPPGLILSASGTISGTPTATGTFNFTVTTSDASGCSGSRAYSITVVCPANPISFTAPSVICSNSAPIVLTTGSPAGGTYSGTGVSGGLFDPAVGTQVIWYDYTDPYGCAHQRTATFTVTDPGAAQATPSSQSICSGASITTIALTNPASGAATFNWTRDNTTEVTGMAASGTGDISGVLVNTTASPVIVTFTITSTVDGCTTPPITVTVEVKNKASVTSPTTLTQTICSGSNITPIVPGGSAGVTAFNWTRNNTASVTGITASGSGNISGALTNTTHTPVNVIFTVTPVAGTCIGTPTNFTITVNPTPVVAAVTVPADATYHGNDPLNFKVDYTEDVVVNTTGGVPSVPVTLNTGGTVQATYISGSGSSSLIFQYTVTATDQDPDGISVGSSLNLNGAIIESTHGCNSTTTLNNISPAAGVKIHNPVPQTITFNGSTLLSKTYGDPDFNPGASSSSTLAITYTSSDHSVATIVGGHVHIVGAGTTTITASQAGDGNYLPAAPIGHALVVNPRNITVTAESKSKIYGSADPALTYTVSPALVAGDAFTGSLSRVIGENTGVYAINQGTLALNSNYAVSYAGNNLAITAKVITVTAETKSKVYGNADPALTYTFSPALVTGDAFTGALSRPAGEYAGAYTINQGTLALSSNYTISYTSASLTITAKAITVTAEAKSKVYGSADPVLTYTVSPALAAGDAFTGALSRATGENTGVYAINQGTLALNSNYAISYTGNNLTVTGKPITVTAEAKSKVYGDADPVLTYTFSPALIAGDAFTGALGRAAGENAGSYVIAQNTLALNSNYVLNYSPANLVISKAVLTATAGDKTICPADVLASVPLSYTGFKNGENASALSSAPVVNIPSHTAAGNYPLTPSGGSATNYSFSYVSGQLTVLQAPSGSITQSPAGAGAYQLTAPTGASYLWGKGETTNAITVRVSDNYSVTVTNQQGCSSRFTLQVNIQTFNIPNTFSPNGDGINDYWTIPELANYQQADVAVVNRDGQVVFNSKNFTRWDGRNAGRDLPAGVYFYRIIKAPGEAPVTGWLNLVR
ncbi:MBG domain-containing protein [Chitinophaga niabensis]|uniref:MBG domain-containing protein n=1 Tax=Chitinophaga niabensis TaxID=536979 RepID=UPI0031B9D4E7